MPVPVISWGPTVIILNNNILSLYGTYLMLRSSVCIHLRANSTGPKGFAHPRTRASRIVEGRDFLLRQACLAASWLRSRLRRATTRSNPLIQGFLHIPALAKAVSSRGGTFCCGKPVLLPLGFGPGSGELPLAPIH